MHKDINSDLINHNPALITPGLVHILFILYSTFCWLAVEGSISSTYWLTSVNAHDDIIINSLV